LFQKPRTRRGSFDSENFQKLGIQGFLILKFKELELELEVF